LSLGIAPPRHRGPISGRESRSSPLRGIEEIVNLALSGNLQSFSLACVEAWRRSSQIVSLPPSPSQYLLSFDAGRAAGFQDYGGSANAQDQRGRGPQAHSRLRIVSMTAVGHNFWAGVDGTISFLKRALGLRLLGQRLVSLCRRGGDGALGSQPAHPDT